ncbi:hypothetical protein PR048_017901 [Dryococelus australis]|uniref:Uncharacterized protein n=1 Tax=Dryococelus australis TaxID=614101 RepID=A0ABQ9HAX4_9NEOP|nr:hypothetical protein PR048_017901 [Dryococelus australis]
MICQEVWTEYLSLMCVCKLLPLYTHTHTTRLYICVTSVASGVASGPLPPNRAVLYSRRHGDDPGFSQVGILPDNADGQRIFSGISRFTRPCALPLLHTQPRLTLMGSQNIDFNCRTDLFIPWLPKLPNITLLLKDLGLNPAQLCNCLYPHADGAAVVERLDCSPPTKANQAQSPAGSHPSFRKCESCRTMPLVSGFSRGSPVSPALVMRPGAAPVSLHFTLICSQGLVVKSRQKVRKPYQSNTSKYRSKEAACTPNSRRTRHQNGGTDHRHVTTLFTNQRLCWTEGFTSVRLLTSSRDHGGRVVSLLASNQDDPCSLPSHVTPGFSHVGIVPDGVAGRWVFSGISCCPPFHSGAAPYSYQSSLSALKTSVARPTPHDSPDKTVGARLARQNLIPVARLFVIPGSSSDDSKCLRGLCNCASKIKERGNDVDDRYTHA